MFGKYGRGVKSKMVREVMGELLFTKGYEIKEDEKLGIWIFTKREGDVIKRISLVEDIERKHLNLYLGTNLDEKRKELIKLVPAKTFDYRGIAYEGKEGFRLTLFTLKTMLIQYGFSELEKMGQVRPLSFSKTVSQYILKNAKEIWNEKIDVWKLNEGTIEERVARLSLVIDEEKGNKFEMSEMPLARIAAVFGEVLIQEFGGQWEWNDYQHFPQICIGVDSEWKKTVHPCRAVLEQWEGKGGVKEELEQIQFSKKQRTYTIKPWEWLK